MRGNPKSEIRNPKSESECEQTGLYILPASRFRALKRRERRAPALRAQCELERGLQPASPYESRPTHASRLTFRISGFDLLSDFGFRISDFKRRSA